MKKLLGNDSGATAGVGGISVHQPPFSSAWLSGSQNSIARPVLSWNHDGKPPTLGLVLMGPMRSRAAWAVYGTNIVMAAATALATPLLILGIWYISSLLRDSLAKTSPVVFPRRKTPFFCCLVQGRQLGAFFRFVDFRARYSHAVAPKRLRNSKN